MTAYRDYQRDLAPPWLQGPYGAAWSETLGAAKDAVLTRAKEGVAARLVARAPADALARLGADRSIERYPGETDAAYRARVAGAWDAWAFAGAPAAILGALRALGFTAVSYHAARDPAPPGEATWPPDGDAANWSRFWILIDVATGANPFGWTVTKWGTGTWGPDRTWGSTATVEQVRLIRRVIRKWKPGHEVCAQVLVDLPDGHRVRWPGME